MRSRQLASKLRKESPELAEQIRVVLGEADASIVYATDATAAGAAIKTITLPPELNVVASYPIATLTNVPNSDAGRLFLEYVLSKSSASQLETHGFRPPSGSESL
jgi:molybdate transport system substrate-binding protein